MVKVLEAFYTRFNWEYVASMQWKINLNMTGYTKYTHYWRRYNRNNIRINMCQIYLA